VRSLRCSVAAFAGTVRRHDSQFDLARRQPGGGASVH
jgi:hypothetical protein